MLNFLLNCKINKLKRYINFPSELIHFIIFIACFLIICFIIKFRKNQVNKFYFFLHFFSGSLGRCLHDRLQYHTTQQFWICGQMSSRIQSVTECTHSIFGGEQSWFGSFERGKFQHHRQQSNFFLENTWK